MAGTRSVESGSRSDSQTSGPRQRPGGSSPLSQLRSGLKLRRWSGEGPARASAARCARVP